MTAVDSSVVVAGMLSWHERHAAARRALDRRPRLVAHCAVESYSVLTRLPAPHRVAPNLVHEFLRAEFPGPYVTLSPAGYARLLRLVATERIVGGAAYDALVARTAAEKDATLLTCDRRARETYDRCGVRVEFV